MFSHDSFRGLSSGHYLTCLSLCVVFICSFFNAISLPGKVFEKLPIWLNLAHLHDTW